MKLLEDPMLGRRAYRACTEHPRDFPPSIPRPRDGVQDITFDIDVDTPFLNNEWKAKEEQNQQPLHENGL